MATSLKARAMLTLAYGCGLRAVADVNLKANADVVSRIADALLLAVLLAGAGSA
jgi:hypothetical protein